MYKSPDIAVIELESGKMYSPPYSGQRQVVAAVDRGTKTFQTMARQGDVFIIRTFDSSCRKVAESSVPVFTEGYCGSTHYALSPNGKQFVYLKDKTRNLYLYDVSSGKESLLWERIADSSLEIQKLVWISDSRVLAALQEGLESSRKTNDIIDLDVNSGNRRTLYHPIYPQNFSYALSPDVSMLAFSDGNKRYDIYGRIKVLDVQTGSVRLILGSGSDLIGNACWSPGGSELAYTEGRELKIWTVATDSIRTIHTFPDRFVCYHVVFGKGVVGYVGDMSGQSHYRESLVLLDSKNGANVREIKAPFNGGIFLLDDGGTFVCEIGI